MNFAIQSSKKSANYLALKTYELISSAKEDLYALTESEFDEIKKGISGNYEQDYKNINEILNLLVKQISKGDNEFYIKDNVVKEFEELTLGRVKEIFEMIFTEEKKILEIHLLSSSMHKENEEIKKKRENEDLVFFDDFDFLKRRCELYPQFNAVIL